MTLPATLSDWENPLRQCVIAEMQTDPAHDLQHIERVVLNTRRLAESEGADLDILLPAAWLHDCVAICKKSPQRSQASQLAADRAIELLARAGYADRHFPAIHHAIHAHSFSAKIAPKTLEARVLQDADRLDALGALGISRCLMLGGHFGSRLYSPDDPFCAQRPPADAEFCVDHFFAKLLTLESTMQTEGGRAEARQRTDFMRSYLDQLRHEIS